jgi:hypothetical protein
VRVAAKLVEQTTGGHSAYAHQMHRLWYVAALVTLGLTGYLVASMPEGCDDGMFSCDGLRVAPIIVVFLGCVVAGSLSFVGFIRSTK